MKRKHVFISGRVQGVFFRASTRDMAKKVGVTGWVKNLSDGRVEAVFEGEEDEVDRMVDFCRKGPSRAIVEDIEVLNEESKGLRSFEIKR